MSDSNRVMPRRVLLGVTSLFLLVLMACARIPTPDGWPSGVVNDDTLFIGTMQGELLAIDRNTRETRWRFALNGDEESERALYSAPVIVDDTIYLGGYDRQLYAISLDGNLRWQEPFEGSIVGSPAVADGKVVVGVADGNVYAIDASDQSVSWKFETGNKVWSTPVISNGIVYFGSLDHNIYAVRLEDGEEVWRLPTGGAIYASALVKDGLVYVGTFEGIFYAINAADGEIVWEFPDADSWYWAAPIAQDGTIYVGSLDGNLYALNAATGTLRWTLSTDDRIVGSPVIVGSLIAVPSDDGKVHIARLGDGTEVFACNIRERVRSSLVQQDGVIYFGAGDSSIRAMSIKPDGNPDEVWVYLTDEDDPIPRDRAPAC